MKEITKDLHQAIINPISLTDKEVMLSTRIGHLRINFPAKLWLMKVQPSNKTIIIKEDSYKTHQVSFLLKVNNRLECIRKILSQLFKKQTFLIVVKSLEEEIF